VVSDGSFKEKFGMAAWVNATLGNGKLITLGYPNDQCTSCSKLSGIYRIVLTLKELAMYQDFTGGKARYTGALNPGTATPSQNTSTSFKQHRQQFGKHHWSGPGSMSRAIRTQK